MKNKKVENKNNKSAKSEEILNFNIDTGLGTLEKVYDILEDVGLESMIDLDANNLNKNDLDLKTVFNKLFKGRKLREFLNIITDGAIGEINLSGEVGLSLVKAFFLDTMSSWGIQDLVKRAEMAQAVIHKKAHSTA